MTGTIKVTPLTLRNTASDFSSQGASIQSLMSDMMTRVTGLKNYWEGDAANAYISRFQQLQDDITRMLNMCTEHSNDLIEMANIYEQYDQQAEELTSGLAVEVIV